MAYILRRGLVSAVLIFIVSTIVFSVLYLVPGDPAELLLSGGGTAPEPSAVEEMRQKLGLDQPMLTQYLAFLSRLAHFDLGTSFTDDSSVSAEVMRRLPRTLELVLVATLISVVVGLPFGALAAQNIGGRIDRMLSSLSGLALATPVFVTGTLLILIFAQKLRWSSAGGFVSFTDAPLRHIGILILPSVTIAFGLTAVVFRMVRTTVLEITTRDWVRTANAKGLSPGQTMRRHVVRNALGPVVTVVGLNMGYLLGGTVLVEYVFNWPGLSSMLVQAVEQRDYPIVQGIVLVISTLFVLLNLLIDILYGVLDPRVQNR
jgi:peptide/nickel transport system permease protein